MRIAITGAERAIGALLAKDLARDHDVREITPAQLETRTAAEAALGPDGGAPLEAIVHAYAPEAAYAGGILSEMSDEEWDGRCEAVLRATIHTLQAARTVMPGGVVVVVLPNIGLAGQKGFGAYSAACEAQRCLVKACARAWGRKGFRLHSIAASPLLFEGDLARDGEAVSALLRASLPTRDAAQLGQDLIDAARFLLSDKAAGLTGSTLSVDAGRWMPL